MLTRYSHATSWGQCKDALYPNFDVDRVVLRCRWRHQHWYTNQVWMASQKIGGGSISIQCWANVWILLGPPHCIRSLEIEGYGAGGLDFCWVYTLHHKNDLGWATPIPYGMVPRYVWSELAEHTQRRMAWQPCITFTTTSRALRKSISSMPHMAMQRGIEHSTCRFGLCRRTYKRELIVSIARGIGIWTLTTPVAVSCQYITWTMTSGIGGIDIGRASWKARRIYRERNWKECKTWKTKTGIAAWTVARSLASVPTSDLHL